VSKAFKTWKDRRKKIIELALKVQRELGTAADPSVLMKNWVEELQSFNNYIEPINTDLGLRATKRLASWFETGEIAK
jgi:hypothetical protein